MKLTEQDKRMFKHLQNNRALVEYLNRLLDWICDIRNGKFDEETRKLTRDIIEKELLGNLTLQNDDKSNPEPFLGEGFGE